MNNPPRDPKKDFVGPPDPDSNICRTKFRDPANETEKKYQDMVHETNEWNHNYWTKHNKDYDAVSGSLFLLLKRLR